MGAGASVEAQALGSIPEEEAVDRLRVLYKQDPGRVERIISKVRQQIDIEAGARHEQPPHQPGEQHLHQPAPTPDGGAEVVRGERSGGGAPEAVAAVRPTAGTAGGSALPSSDVTTPEQVLAIINAVRTHPQSFIPHMEERLKRFDGKKLKSHTKGQPNIQTIEGPAAVEETVQYLQTAPPVPPLTLVDGLCRAARDHMDDIGPKGLATHAGSDGSSMQDRIERHGDWKELIGENLDFGNRSALDIILSLLVDDNVPSRGHRNNIMNERFKTVGVAWGPHTRYRFACVLEFAGGYGPKVQRLTEPVKIVDAEMVDERVQQVLDSIPFDDVKAQVITALTGEEKYLVDLDYRPGEIEVRLKNEKGSTVLNGTWTVQHQT